MRATVPALRCLAATLAALSLGVDSGAITLAMYAPPSGRVAPGHRHDVRRTTKGRPVLGLDAISDVLRGYPGFLPGVIVSLVVSLAAAGIAGRSLGVRRSVGWLLVFGFGIVLAATLTPGRETTDFGITTAGYCDLSRWRPAPFALLSFNNTSLNVYLLIPLGMATGLLPRTRRKLALVVIALALSPGVEMIQSVVTVLGRACQSGDVIDNETGLLIGLLIGTVAGRLVPALVGAGSGTGAPDRDADPHNG